MYLKEFWLDLSYDHFGIGEREYVDENHPAHNEIAEFYLETKCVTNFFERIFNERIYADFKRVIVECHKNNMHKEFVITDSVCTVNILFDYEEYKCADYEKRKHIILSTMMQGINKLADTFKWEKHIFDNVAKVIMEANYINRWIWKTIYNSEKNIYVKLICSVERSTFKLIANLYNYNDELIYTKEVVEDSPDESIYRRYFGKTKWKSNSILEIYNKGGKNAVVAARVDFSDYLD